MSEEANTKEQIEPHTKKSIIIKIVLALAIVLLIAGAFFIFKWWQNKDVVVIIDKTEITKQQIDRQAELDKKVAAYYKIPDYSKNITAEDRLVEAATIRAIAKENNITATNEEITTSVKALADKSYKGNLDDLYKFHMDTLGLTKEEVDQNHKTSLLNKKIEQKLVSTASGQYIATRIGATVAQKEAAAKRLESIKQELDSGKNFSALLTELDQKEPTETTQGVFVDTSSYNKIIQGVKVNNYSAIATHGNQQIIVYVTKKTPRQFDNYQLMWETYTGRHYNTSSISKFLAKINLINVAYALPSAGCNWSSIYGCLTGTARSQAENLCNYQWVCGGTGFNDTSCGYSKAAKSAISGACNNTTPNTCTSPGGAVVNYSADPCSSSWMCEQTLGCDGNGNTVAGSRANCSWTGGSAASGAAGVCNGNSGCSVGTATGGTYDGCIYRYNCSGTAGSCGGGAGPSTSCSDSSGCSGGPGTCETPTSCSSTYNVCNNGSPYNGNGTTWYCQPTDTLCSDISCGISPTKYKCSTSGSCVPDPSGTYPDSSCNEQCGITQNKYSCVSGGRCVVDATGKYSTLEDCNSKCGISPTKYKCNTSGQCVTDPNGTFDRFDCDKSCSIQSPYCGTRARAYTESENSWPAGSTYCARGSSKISPFLPNSPLFPEVGKEVTWDCSTGSFLWFSGSVTCKANRTASPPPTCTTADISLISPENNAPYLVTETTPVIVSLDSIFKGCSNQSKYIRNLFRWTKDSSGSWTLAGSGNEKNRANLNLTTPVSFLYTDIAKEENKKTDVSGVYYEATYLWGAQGSYDGTNWQSPPGPTPPAYRQFTITTRNPADADKLSCSINPSTGVTPLVTKIVPTSSGKCVGTYIYTIKKSGNPTPILTRESNGSTGIFYTFDKEGKYTTQIETRNQPGCSAQCNEVTATSSGGGSGGEVAP